MSGAVNLLKQYYLEVKSGNFANLENACAETDILLDSSNMQDIADILNKLDLASREEVRAILFEAHLKRFPYSVERIEEYTKLDQILTDAYQHIQE